MKSIFNMGIKNWVQVNNMIFPKFIWLIQMHLILIQNWIWFSIWVPFLLSMKPLLKPINVMKTEETQEWAQ